MYAALSRRWGEELKLTATVRNSEPGKRLGSIDLALVGDAHNARNHGAERGLYLAFPGHEYAPSECLQSCNIRSITDSVRGELALPELGVCRRCRGEAAPLMAVPEAPMYEDRKAPRREHDVGAPRKVATMQTKSKAGTVQGRAKRTFWRCVPIGNAGHIVAALGFGVNVNQRE